MGCGLWMINDGVAWSRNHALKQAALFDAFLTDAYSNSLGLTLSEAILATSRRTDGRRRRAVRCCHKTATVSLLTIERCDGLWVVDDQ
jgi:hypothetical protein